MFQFLSKMSSKDLNKEQIAAFLKTSPEALDAFEKSYHALLDENTSDNFFEINAKQAAEGHEGIITDDSNQLDDVMNRIVNELINTLLSGSITAVL